MLLMDELPAIIHRLSLRLLVPEYREKEDSELAHEAENAKLEEVAVDPFASPPQDPVDINGNILDANQIASLSLDSRTEVQSLFSRKNLLRLAALSDSSHTLSLFSPTLRDVVFRAWAGPLERGEMTEITAPYGFPLSRKPSAIASPSITGAFSDAASQSTRPSTNYSAFNSTALGRHTRPGRKRKHRVVNMRKPKLNAGDDDASVSGESSYSATHSSATSDNAAPPSEPIGTRDIDATPRPPRRANDKKPQPLFEAGPPSADDDLTPPVDAAPAMDASTATIRPRPRRYFGSWQPPTGDSTRDGPSATSAHFPGTSSPLRRNMSGRLSPPAQLAAPFPYAESSPGGILEQAWMMRMAGEIARRVEEQKRGGAGGENGSDAGFWAGGGEAWRDAMTPPPAYTK